MTRHAPGDEIEVVITYLEMAARPDYPRPPAPLRPGLALIRAENPPVRWFLHLYTSVGADYEWTDQLRADPAEVAAFVGDERVAIYTLMQQGWSAGFFMLDGREAGTCDIAYFGLAPEAAGRGLGSWLLQTAVHAAWDMPGVETVTVNTCTLDHPRALPLYQKCGFTPVRRETTTRVLDGPWPRKET